MAAADYYYCDVCGRRTFYDADCSYTKDKVDTENLKPLLYGVGQILRYGDLLFLVTIFGSLNYQLKETRDGIKTALLPTLLL